MDTTEIEVGSLIFVQNQTEDEEDSGYKYAIDSSTGNLLVLTEIQEENGETPLENNNGNDGEDGDGSGESTLAIVKVFKTGEYVLETFDPEQEEQEEGEGTLIFKTEKVGNEEEAGTSTSKSNQGKDNERNPTEVPDIGPESNTSVSATIRPQKVIWSDNKVVDLLECIQNHQQKFRNWSKIMNVWNIISLNMVELGHKDCNKDECSKKWSNLYRTWRTSRLRPKEARKKWRYYSKVARLVKSLTSSQKGSPNRGTINRNVAETFDLIGKLQKAVILSQNAIQEAEQQFQLRVAELDRERDAVLSDIHEILQTKSTVGASEIDGG